MQKRAHDWLFFCNRIFYTLIISSYSLNISSYLENVYIMDIKAHSDRQLCYIPVFRICSTGIHYPGRVSQLVFRSSHVCRIQDANFEVVGMFINPLEAVDKIKTLQPQIVYLDIHMPQLKGIDAASIAPLWM